MYPITIFTASDLEHVPLPVPPVSRSTAPAPAPATPAPAPPTPAPATPAPAPPAPPTPPTPLPSSSCVIKPLLIRSKQKKIVLPDDNYLLKFDYVDDNDDFFQPSRR